MAKYFALAPDRIATAPIAGGIEITAEQYSAALAALTDPNDKRIISTEGGVFALVVPPPPVALEPPPPTQDEILARLRRAVQGHIDKVAQSRGYDYGDRLASYVTSTNAVWAAEAQAFVAWRDVVWVYVHAEIDKVTAGQRPMPVAENFIAELPPMAWPT